MTSEHPENPTTINDRTDGNHDKIAFLPPELERFFSDNVAFVVAIDFDGNRTFLTKSTGLTIDVFPRDVDMRLPAVWVNKVDSLGVVHFERNPPCTATTTDNMQIHVHK